MSLRSRRIRSLQDESEEPGPSRRTAAHTPQRSFERLKATSKRRRDVEDEVSDVSLGEDSPTEIPLTPAKTALSKLTDEEITRKVKGLVRLALCSELKKVPIRREDIMKKVLQEHSKVFQEIFDRAQYELRDIYGMELVELPTKEKKPATRSGTVRRATLNNKATSSACKSYTLVNILPEELKGDDIIHWQRDEESIMGLLTVILSLILVNGHILTDDQLKDYITRLHLHEANETFGDVEKLLLSFVKQGYLGRQKSGMIDQISEKENVEYIWGPRAKVEIPKENLIQFIKMIFGPEAPQDLARQIERVSGFDG
ncbi:hypothetical protein G9A89_008811 [Geosiphon pyriformis]|nr:hypothetical protein G9A89_008811 [Geosiphon pyriformis]